MKIFLAVFLCLFFGFNVFGQTDAKENVEEIGIGEISLARDDGHGKAGESVDGFVTTDVPIHCFIALKSTKAAVVKMNLVAAKADGLKPETTVVAVSYKTSGTQNGVNFDASPETIWTAGKYRVDIFLDGKLEKSREFEIKKSPKEIGKEKPTPEIKPKPKIKQKPRKS